MINEIFNYLFVNLKYLQNLVLFVCSNEVDTYR